MTQVAPVIRPARPEDAAAIAEIYNYYIEHTAVSFEETPVTAAEMRERMSRVTPQFPWLVAEEKGKDLSRPALLGYAYIHRWHERAAYRYTVEDSIYLKHGCEGRGLGSALMRRLLDEIKNTGIHAVMSCVTQPNEGSVSLLEKFGFKKIGHFREVGFKLGKWLDVGYWELIRQGIAEGDKK